MNPDLCAECAVSGESCCRRARVPLTSGDERRIADWSGTGPDAWTEAIPAAGEFSVTGDSLWDRFLAARNRILAFRPEGGCVFLEPAGCALPPKARPLVCRLYPFEYDEQTIKGVHAPLCPAPFRRNAPLLLALLGMERLRAEAWRARLYREMAEDARGD